MQKNRVKKIHILKDSRGLGVQILMKLNHETREKGVFVSDVSPGGAAARYSISLVLINVTVRSGLQFKPSVA